MFSHRTRLGAAAAAATAGLLTITSAGTAWAGPDADPQRIADSEPLDPSQVDVSQAPAFAKDQQRTWFVRFEGRGVADLRRSTPSARLQQRSTIRGRATDAVTTARTRDARASRLFVLTNSVPGVGVRTTPAGAKALEQRRDVVSVTPVVPRTTSNANAAVLERAVNAWRRANGLGEGVKVGIIDTGIDYTHATFGGPGTTTAYDREDPTSADWRSRLPRLGKAKIRGGYDFAGDDYNADPTSEDYQPSPSPDPNPLDYNGHGSHVAGTAAGYGVTEAGKPFTGDYSSLNASALKQMKVGPGMAPAAQLYGLKVFGTEGSTDLVLPALDWALDPNGDGDFSDRLDIVNMSLGSAYGAVDDPQNLVVNALSRHGVLTVNSEGNEGDTTDIGGSPGSSASALTVASTVDGYQLLDGLRVDAPADLAGVVAGQNSVAYDWANEEPVSGDVAPLSEGNADGCSTLSGTDAAAVQGKVAWLEWDSNDGTRRCGSVARAANVEAAGAVGAIFTGDVNPFGAGITGSANIPVFQLTKTATDRLRPAAEAGTLAVTFDGELTGSQQDQDPSISDTISSFSSRGAHGSLGVVKPDVAAVGDSVVSAMAGSGSEPTSISGTSMASPNVAGIAALVAARQPSWTPAMLKAAVMNTAVHDVWTGPNKTGDRYAPARVGAGRVDASRATSASLLVDSPGGNGRVSAVFGVVSVPEGSEVLTRTRKVRVRNTGNKATTATLRYEPVNSTPGITYSVSPSTLNVGAGKSATAEVTMRVDGARLRRTMDPTMAEDMLGMPLRRDYVPDSSGRLVVERGDGGAPYRLPVYGTAEPVSTTKGSVNEAGDGIDLTGQGVAQGFGGQAYRSLASVLELGASDGRTAACTYPDSLPGCTTAADRASDLRYIGAGQGDGLLYFGLASYDDWAQVGGALTPYVDYDTDGDGAADYQTYVDNYGNGDVYVAITVDLAAGPDADPVDVQLLNFTDGDTDTNKFDTNVALLPVDPTLLDLPTDGAAPVDYTVGVYNGASGTVLEEVSTEQPYQVGEPRISTENALYDDQGGTTIPIEGSGGAQALLVHLNGTPGARAEVLDVP